MNKKTESSVRATLWSRRQLLRGLGGVGVGLLALGCDEQIVYQSAAVDMGGAQPPPPPPGGGPAPDASADQGGPGPQPAPLPDRGDEPGWLEETIATWEAGGVLTPNAPGEWGGKIAGHFPIASVEGDEVVVRVSHPYDNDHFIDGIYLRDATGALVGFQLCGPGVLPVARFPLVSDPQSITAYASCNLHQVWSAPVVRSAQAPGPWADKIAGHTPAASWVGANEVEVTVPHAMDPDHFIAAIYLSGPDGSIIAKTQLNPSDHPEAIYRFELAEALEEVTPWALCDDHDIWVGETISS